jgi:hypothetical protein
MEGDRMKKKSRVGMKISKLRHEGVKQDQAVGEAMGMESEGRIGKRGGYRRGKRKARK